MLFFLKFFLLKLHQGAYKTLKLKDTSRLSFNSRLVCRFFLNYFFLDILSFRHIYCLSRKSIFLNNSIKLIDFLNHLSISLYITHEFSSSTHSKRLLTVKILKFFRINSIIYLKNFFFQYFMSLSELFWNGTIFKIVYFLLRLSIFKWILSKISFKTIFQELVSIRIYISFNLFFINNLQLLIHIFLWLQLMTMWTFHRIKWIFLNWPEISYRIRVVPQSYSEITFIFIVGAVNSQGCLTLGIPLGRSFYFHNES